MGMKETILLELVKHDKDGNKRISKPELVHVMQDPITRTVLKYLDVDVEYMSAVQHMLLPTDQSQASAESVLDMMLNCRGSLPVTVKHLVGGQVFQRWLLK